MTPAKRTRVSMVNGTSVARPLTRGIHKGEVSFVAIITAAATVALGSVSWNMFAFGYYTTAPPQFAPKPLPQLRGNGIQKTLRAGNYQVRRATSILKATRSDVEHYGTTLFGGVPGRTSSSVSSDRHGYRNLWKRVLSGRKSPLSSMSSPQSVSTETQTGIWSRVLRRLQQQSRRIRKVMAVTMIVLAGMRLAIDPTMASTLSSSASHSMREANMRAAQTIVVNHAPPSLKSHGVSVPGGVQTNAAGPYKPDNPTETLRARQDSLVSNNQILSAKTKQMGVTRAPKSSLGISSPTIRRAVQKSAYSAKRPLASVPTVSPSKQRQQKLKDSTKTTFREAVRDLSQYMQGTKSDTLILLLATALVTPVCQRLGTSPILGFLAAGMVLGPNALGLISGIHTTETLADLGIVFFLFEMGIELSFDRLLSMKKDVFGLGLSQFLTTSVAVATIGSFFKLPANALVVLGGGIALSSSAFVLQLLKDKDQLATRFGKASFGVLLFQDLAVVPLLVVTPILAGGGSGLASALSSAVIKAAMALGSIAFAGRVVLNPLFRTVAQANSQEAFLGLILLTVLSMSFMTEGLGLSNTLGAFLAGVLLSETKYRYQVEADIAPFRGVLLGLFFVTVGFEIDFHLVSSNLPAVTGIVLGIVGVKALVTTALSLAFGLSMSNSQQAGLILSQSGEFAFVAFGLARSLGIIDPATTKLMLTCVALTMALTPFLSDVGARVAKRLEEGSDFTHYLGQDRDANEIKESDDFVVVVGYGIVGKIVCDLLDAKFIKYVGLELDPNKAIQARNKGLPVFFGDIGRPEVAEAFNVEHAKAVIVTISEKAGTNRVVISLRRLYPNMKIFARAVDAEHARRLQSNLDVAAMVPIVPEDNVLLTLPFGGAVLRSLGAPVEEVNAILEAKRKEVLSLKGLAESEAEDFLAQLGISSERENEGDSTDVVIDTDKESGTSDGGAAGSSSPSAAEAAAAAAVNAAKEVNPIVAEIIEANVLTGASSSSGTTPERNVTEAVVSVATSSVMEGEEEDE